MNADEGSNGEVATTNSNKMSSFIIKIYVIIIIKFLC